MGKHNDSSEPNLKGTLVGVFAVGIITAAMWFATYAIYLSK